MRRREGEEGAALLSVLLLVAVMATIAATALDRVQLATRMTGNTIAAAQARHWLDAASAVATTRVEDLLAADKQKTLPTGWLGIERTLPLPGAAIVQARLDDGGNCFNLNSLVQPVGGDRLAARPSGILQFRRLMISLNFGEAKAARIADSAADHADSDSFPLSNGREDGGDTIAPNQLFSDVSELRSVAGVVSTDFQLLKPLVCALPTTDLSPINVNTLLPAQAPLLAMLGSSDLDLARARLALSSRPAAGFTDAAQFWRLPALADIAPEIGAANQLKTRTEFFRFTAVVRSGALTVQRSGLIDARQKPALLVSPRWSEEG